MGYRTLLLINNDLLDEISRDSSFGSKIDYAAREYFCGDKEKARIDCGSAKIIGSFHHTETRNFIVNDCSGRDIGINISVDCKKDEDIERALLRGLANKYGYYLSKKNVKNGILDKKVKLK